MRRLTRALALLALGGAAFACAQQVSPPGGPPDPTPPQVVRIVPESGLVNVRPPAVVFRFDEVVAERPARGTSLAQLVLISPRDGEPVVRWRRNELTVRPPRDWRPNTTYTVELRPGVADLRGNVRTEVARAVFSTGSSITPTLVQGMVWDWVQQRPIVNSMVEAVTLRDSVVFVTRGDSVGRFAIPHVTPGPVTIRAIADDNRNFALDPREAWDTVSVTLADTATLELYLVVRDSVPPTISAITVQDSVTLLMTLDRPLAVDQPLDAQLVRVVTSDSVALPLVAVERPPVQPPAAPADTAPIPIAPPAASPTRPPPVTRILIRTAQPLVPGQQYRVYLVNARNLIGVEGTSDRVVSIPVAAPAPQPAGPPGSSR